MANDHQIIQTRSTCDEEFSYIKNKLISTISFTNRTAEIVLKNKIAISLHIDQFFTPPNKINRVFIINIIFM